MYTQPTYFGQVFFLRTRKGKKMWNGGKREFFASSNP